MCLEKSKESNYLGLIKEMLHWREEFVNPSCQRQTKKWVYETAGRIFDEMLGKLLNC